MTTSASPASTASAMVDNADVSEIVSELSFDELRELPVRMQMGLDLSACDDD